MICSAVQPRSLRASSKRLRLTRLKFSPALIDFCFLPVPFQPPASPQPSGTRRQSLRALSVLHSTSNHLITCLKKICEFLYFFLFPPISFFPLPPSFSHISSPVGMIWEWKRPPKCKEPLKAVWVPSFPCVRRPGAPPEAAGPPHCPDPGHSAGAPAEGAPQSPGPTAGRETFGNGFSSSEGVRKRRNERGETAIKISQDGQGEEYFIRPK